MDVRDLGGHLDVTQRAMAGTLSDRVKKSGVPTNALDGVLQISTCVKVVPSLYLGSALSDLRWAGAAWSNKCPMTDTPPLLILLDAPEVQIPHSLIFGTGSAKGGVFLLGDFKRKSVFTVCWTTHPGPLDTVPSICLLTLLLRLASLVILNRKVGSELVFLLYA